MRSRTTWDFLFEARSRRETLDSPYGIEGLFVVVASQLPDEPRIEHVGEQRVAVAGSPFVPAAVRRREFFGGDDLHPPVVVCE